MPPLPLKSPSSPSSPSPLQPAILKAPPYPPLSGVYPTSFAYVTLRDRLPVILTQLIDRLARFGHEQHMLHNNQQSQPSPPKEASTHSPTHSPTQRRSRASTMEEKRRTWHVGAQAAVEDQARTIVSALSRLRYELQCNKPLTPVEFGDPVDILRWSMHLDQQPICTSPDGDASMPTETRTWFNVPWLFAECYLYRRVRDCFLEADKFYENTGVDGGWLWSRDYDYFAEPKLKSTDTSMKDMLQVAVTLQNYLAVHSSRSPLDREFEQLLQGSLWGNQVDLSMSAGRTDAEISNNHHTDHDQATRDYVLANDSVKLWAYLEDSLRQQTPGRKFKLVVVLDNAGAELFMDLCLADWLCVRGVVTEVVFHMKEYPWFVSDVVHADVNGLVKRLRELSGDATTAEEQRAAHALADRWKHYSKSGTWTFTSHWFWTSGHAYWNMHVVAPEVYAELRASDLCLFKGDLNYRKLVFDCCYPHPYTAPFFRDAVGPEMALVKLVALRTCKADVVAGLKRGVAQRLDDTVGKNHLDQGWLVCGKYAVIQSTL